MKQILRAKIYGDSIMKGTILDAGYRYHAIMNEYLIKLYDRFGIEAENRARFGITVKRGHSILLRDIDEGLDCELALVEFGGNDSDFDWAAVAAAPHDEHRCKTDPEDFVRKYSEIIAQLRAAGCEPVLSTLPPLCAERYLKWFCRDGVDMDAVLFWLGDAQAIYRWQEYYSHLVERVAQLNGCNVMQLRDAFLATPQKHGDRMCDDGIHPNRKGQDLIYETIRKKFNP